MTTTIPERRPTAVGGGVEPINVTLPYLPPKEALYELLDGVWQRGWLTNGGPLAEELTERLRAACGIPHFQWVNNGTTALQLAIRALDLEGDILTTPLSYVATPNSIAYEGCNPVFVDVNPETLVMDPSAMEAALTPDTVAIMPVHLYGYPCNIAETEAFAKTHGLAVVYDAAQAFGTGLGSRSLAAYGDVTTYSFHATKVFHTVEGGGICTADPEVAERLDLYRTHGHRFDDYQQIGINAKNTELHAAVGLLTLDSLNDIITARRNIYQRYREAFAGSDQIRLLRAEIPADISYNYAYAPVVFSSEKALLEVKARLQNSNIYSRRYFWPALNTLAQFPNAARCPVAEDVALRLLCLPIYPQLAHEDVDRIVSIVLQDSRS